MDCSLPGSTVHGILQARMGVGCHFLLQGIVPTQGSNPGLLHLMHWQVSALPLVPPGKTSFKIYYIKGEQKHSSVFQTHVLLTGFPVNVIDWFSLSFGKDLAPKPQEKHCLL